MQPSSSATGRPVVLQANQQVHISPDSLLTLAGVSAFMKTLLDDPDASAALTTLGVSAFIKTLLDDPDATTALSTLGASAIGKAIFGAADADAVLALIGAASSATPATTGVTLASGVSNYTGSNDPPCRVFRVAGVKAIEGAFVLSANKAANDAIFTVPAGFAAANRQFLEVGHLTTDTVRLMSISTDGIARTRTALTNGDVVNMGTVFYR